MNKVLRSELAGAEKSDMVLTSRVTISEKKALLEKYHERRLELLGTLESFSFSDYIKELIFQGIGLEILYGDGVPVKESANVGE